MFISTKGKCLFFFSGNKTEDDSSSGRILLFLIVSKYIFSTHKPQNASLRSTKRTLVDCEYL